MPTREAPADVNQPQDRQPVSETGLETAVLEEASVPEAEQNGAGPRPIYPSRWVEYDTHELLQMISELEDERRWARLREGVLWAILLHGLVILAIAMLPKYVFQPRVIEPDTARIHDRDWTYIDSPPLPAKPAPKAPIKPAPDLSKLLDKDTLEAMKRAAPPPPPPVVQEPQAPMEQKPQPTQPIPPNPQAQIEAPRPAAVPARPNFAMESGNPADQLRRDMQSAARNRSGESAGVPIGGGLPMHPGAGTGGLQILSDTQGVDFNAWLAAWYYETKRTWDPLIPEEVNPPISKQGQVMIRFKVLPNGRLMDGSVVLEGRSGDVALDRAAWGALTGSSYPPLPKDFHGPYIELRAWFLYNMEPSQ